MKPGNVVLAPILQADGQAKLRPVLVLALMKPFGDCLVCGISSQLRQEVAGFDAVMQPQDDDYPGSGLKFPSLIRLGFLAVHPSRDCSRILGRISQARLKILLVRLSQHLARCADDIV